MQIKTIEIAGIASALEALRLPFGLDARSESNVQIGVDENPNPDANKQWGTSCYVDIHPKDLALMSTLVRRGDEHAKVLRGVMVWAKITAPVYWWCELETYRAGHERLASNSTMHQDCRGLSGDALVAAKASIPMGKELTKVDVFSYQCLRNIVRQRWNHRLPEWHSFIEWVDSMPFVEELIYSGLEFNDGE